MYDGYNRNNHFYWHFSNAMQSLQLRLLLVHVQSHMALIPGRGELWTVIKVFHTLISFFFLRHQGNPCWLGWLYIRSEHSSLLTEPPPPSEAHHNLRNFDPTVLFMTVASASKSLGLSSRLYEPNEEDVFSTLQYAGLERPLAAFSRPLFCFIRSFSCGGLGWCLC